MPTALLEFEMVEHFGSGSEYREAGYWDVVCAECVWYGKKRAEAIREQRIRESYTG